MSSPLGPPRDITGHISSTNPLINASHVSISAPTTNSFFFLNDPAPPEFYPLSLPDALPISTGWTRWTPSPARSSRREPCLDTSPPDPQLSALYQELILDHYRRPRNKGTLEHATHAVSLNNPLCGDEIDLQLRVDDDIIKEAPFIMRGCSI